MTTTEAEAFEAMPGAHQALTVAIEQLANAPGGREAAERAEAIDSLFAEPVARM